MNCRGEIGKKRDYPSSKLHQSRDNFQEAQLFDDKTAWFPPNFHEIIH